jgi:alkylation response protein AidB-like acyl-CoA dehydrogenase
MENTMNFAFSEEQDELRKSVRRFLEDKSPETEVRRLMETSDGYDPAVWTQMAEQLGLQSLIIPEQFGGAGFTYVELIVVLEEMGAALLCAPFFSTVALATNAILASGDQSAQEYLLPGIAGGETIATLAFTEDSGRWDADGITLSPGPRRPPTTAGRSTGTSRSSWTATWPGSSWWWVAPMPDCPSSESRAMRRA